MKTQITVITEPVVLTTDGKKEELKNAIRFLWDEFYTKEELEQDIELGYIFGKYASNQHFQREWIMELIDEIELEKAPVPVTEIKTIPLLNDKGTPVLDEKGEVILQEEAVPVLDKEGIQTFSIPEAIPFTNPILVAPVEDVSRIDFPPGRNPIQDTTIIKQMTGEPIIDVPIITSTEMSLEEPTISE